MITFSDLDGHSRYMKPFLAQRHRHGRVCTSSVETREGL